MNELKILLVEDSIDDVALIEHLLKKERISFTSTVVEKKEDYEKALQEFAPEVIICDHSLPQFDSMAALRLFRKYQKQYDLTSAFILVTGTVSEEFAVKAIQSGADDYILKDRLKRLPSAVINALEKNRLKAEQKKTQDEKLHLLDILQRSLNEIYVFDAETFRFVYTNKEALENLGYTAEEMKELTPLDVLHEFDEKSIMEVLQKVENSKKGRIFETHAVRKDHSLYPIQIHLQFVEQGSQKTFVANVLDITENKEHEQQRELAMFIQDCFNQKNTLQTSLEKVLGELATRSQIPAAEIWVRDLVETEIRRFAFWTQPGKKEGKSGSFFAERVFRTGKPIPAFELENEKLLIDGKVVQEDYYKGAMAFPIRSGNEITAAIVMFTQKIIDERDPFVNLKEGVQDKLASNIRRKKTEEELQKVFELSPDVLAVIGKDGYFKKVNPSLERILGYHQGYFLQVPVSEMIHPDDQKLLKEWKSSDLQEGEVAHYESRFRTVEGSYRWFAWSITPFLKKELAFTVGKDVTDYKKQVKKIKKQNKKLAEIAWEQSHVVRAPLSRLLACIAYLEEGGEDREKMLTCIKESAYEIDAVVRTIVKKTEKIKSDERYSGAGRGR